MDTSLNIVATYNLFIGSAYRSNGTTSNFTINLVRPIILSNPNNWFSIRVGSAEIPYNFKLINSTNNQITYQIVRNSITYSATITIEPGNYNILTLLTEFKSKLSSSILTVTGYDPSSNLNFTYNRNTGKVTFSFLPTDSITTTISILNADPVILRCFGYTNVFVFGYTSPSNITPSTSTQNVNVSQNTAIYVRSENLTQTSNFESVVSSNEASDILAKCQIMSLPGTLIQWTNSTDLEIDLSNKIIDTINLYLGDAQNYELDLGNLDWTCRLTVQEWSYKQDSHAQDRIPATPSIDPTVYDELVKTRNKALQRLEKLKSKVNVVDATQEIKKNRQEG